MLNTGRQSSHHPRKAFSLSEPAFTNTSYTTDLGLLPASGLTTLSPLTLSLEWTVLITLIPSL